MSLSKVEILSTKKEWIISIGIILLFFTISISSLYLEYKEFNSIKTNIDVHVINSYKKYNKNHKLYNILVCKYKSATFYTTIWGEINDIKLRDISMRLIIKNISFYDYLKGFFVVSYNHQIGDFYDARYGVYHYLDTLHDDKFASEFYSAIFLATPISKQSRAVYANLGVSHLIALSGFHIGVLSGLLFFIISPIYKLFQQRFFPYRNRFYDVSIAVLIILFMYLLFVDFVPSLLRAFAMIVVGAYLFYRYVEILNFKSLLIVVILLVSIFPKLLFSIGFLLSVSGVFYIYLFIQYTQSLSKLSIVLFLNIWIYFAMLPVVHYFFGTYSHYQLLSPIISLLFTIFYPLVFITHILQIPQALDFILIYISNIEFNSYDIKSSSGELIIYTLLSLYAIRSRVGFILLNLFLGYFFAWNFLIAP